MTNRKLNRVRTSALLLGLLLGLLLAACRPAPEQVTLQLSWSHDIQFVGYYVAKEKGFYADENLDVTFREGGFPVGVDVPQSLAISRTVDLAIMTFDEFKGIMASGSQPVVVMATQQIPPPVLFARADSGIQKPQDLVGRRVAIKGEVWRGLIHNLLTETGVDLKKITEVDVAYDDIKKFYNGEVDVWAGYAHDEPVRARLAGYNVNLIFLADYGQWGYESLLTVRQDTLDKNSDMVARFVRASWRGWRYAIEHPDEAAKIVLKWRPGESEEYYQQSIRALIPLVDTGQVPVGWIDAQRWQTTMGAAYNPQRPGYTMQFVQEAQQKK